MGRCDCVNFGWVGGSHSGHSSSSANINVILRNVFLQFENIDLMISFFISVILVPPTQPVVLQPGVNFSVAS